MLKIPKIKSFKSGDIYIVSGIMFLLFVVFIYYLQSTDLKEKLVSVRPVDDKVEEPFIPKYIGTGLQKGSFSHGKQVTGPKILTVEFNPIDPKIGGEIVLTLYIEHDSPITNGQVIMNTDKEVFKSGLELIEGDYLKGKWRSKVKVTDSYDRIYLINFIIKSDTGDYEGGISLRP